MLLLLTVVVPGRNVLLGSLQKVELDLASEDLVVKKEAVIIAGPISNVNISVRLCDGTFLIIDRYVLKLLLWCNPTIAAIRVHLGS